MRSTRAFNTLKVVYLSLFLYRCLAVPIGRVIGCGKEDPDLSSEQRKFCCESFLLDCEESEFPASRSQDKPPTEPLAKQQAIYERLVPKRNLGSPCQEPVFSCAVGLECRIGLCRRVRSQKHLERLLERGKLVEREEKEDLEDGPEPSRKTENDDELTLHGQSVSVEHVYPRGIPRSTWHDRDTVSSKNLEAFDASSARRKTLEDESKFFDGDSSIFEEDEVTANVADLLASRLHISLNASQVHSIRDVIAGTLDERAQREDEADRTEPAKLDTALLPIVLTAHTDSNRNYTCSAPVVKI